MNYSDNVFNGQVAILMATYNAEKFIREQLVSFANQTYPFWKLYVSDDGSTDSSVKVISDFISNETDHDCLIKDGPKCGFAANFMSLVCNSDIKAAYYAYSDQDDIWDEDKLNNAISRLAEVDSAIPALYCSSTLLIDDENNLIGASPVFPKKPVSVTRWYKASLAGIQWFSNHAAKKIRKKRVK
ncbi:hypothetical protein CWS02_09550 [Enterobacter sp. EA-1]|nr:hypothetical protein CWS02_09550 [Enterobacter sp. EA-1]